MVVGYSSTLLMKRDPFRGGMQPLFFNMYDGIVIKSELEGEVISLEMLTPQTS